MHGGQVRRGHPVGNLVAVAVGAVQAERADEPGVQRLIYALAGTSAGSHPPNASRTGLLNSPLNTPHRACAVTAGGVVFMTAAQVFHCGVGVSNNYMKRKFIIFCSSFSFCVVFN